MAATQFVDAHGVDALTPHVLSQKLNVDLYIIERLCTDRDGLLAVAAKSAAGDLRGVLMESIEEAGPNRVDRLRRVARTYVRFALEHPNVYGLIFRLRFDNPAHRTEVQEELDRLVDALHDGVFRSRKATVATFSRSLFVMLHGLADLALTGQDAPDHAEHLAEQLAVALLS